jgi:hypothetical protein
MCRIFNIDRLGDLAAPAQRMAYPAARWVLFF